MCLQMLNRNKNTKLRNAVLANADADLICSLYECAYNILKGNVKLAKGQKKYSEITENIYTYCPRNKRLQRRRGISCKLVDSCRLCRVDPSTIAETVCRSVDGARQTVGIGRPAIWHITREMDEVDATSNVGSIGSSRRWRLSGN